MMGPFSCKDCVVVYSGVAINIAIDRIVMTIVMHFSILYGS